MQQASIRLLFVTIGEGPPQDFSVLDVTQEALEASAF